jgi:hypothetical protein
VHVSETCEGTGTGTGTGKGPCGSGMREGPRTCEAGQSADRPTIITNVATTDATVPDVAMTEPIHRMPARRDLLPGEHYPDSGYPSAKLIASSAADFGVALITPVLSDHSPQARAGNGFDRSAVTIDFDNQHATCPQGKTSTHRHEATQRGTGVIVARFTAATCRPCPVRDQCTTGTRGRSLTVPPREAHEVQLAARATQNTKDWQAKYALRAGVEGTIRQGIAVTDLRHARYRGQDKTHLQHVLSAVALNLIRLNAWWNAHPLDRTRTSHLTRLKLTLAA